MVRKRSNVESESKIPVKNSPKDKSEAQRDVESLSLSDKDNSDFSANGNKLYSRELRNRFVIASKKRSLRFTNEVNPGRHMRSCRMAITNRQHYTLSQSDDDDHIFAARSSRRLRHPKRRLSSPEPAVDCELLTPAAKRARSSSAVNGHSSKSPPEEEEVPEEDEAVHLLPCARQQNDAISVLLPAANSHALGILLLTAVGVADDKLQKMNNNRVYDEDRVVCPLCDRSLSRLEHLRRHLRSIHFNEKFQYMVCNKLLSRKDKLLSYYKYVHRLHRDTAEPPSGGVQIVELEEDLSGIRRSTRQRKLKYENYSYSWIVGAQTLRGYPQNNYDKELHDAYRSRPYPSRQAKNIKWEAVEEDEEEEEDIKAGPEMETLPIEVIESIAQWLTPRDLAQCSAVSRSWYEMINQDQIWRPRCDPDFEEPLRTIPSVAAPKFEIPQAKTLPPISRWKIAFLREKHLFKNWSRENIDTFKEEDMIRSQNENPWIVDFLSDTQIIACYSAKIEILDISVTPAIVVAKTDQTVSIKRLNKLYVVGTDLLLVRKEDAVRTIRMMRREIRIRKSIEVFKVNIENKSIKLEYEHLFSESSKHLGLKGNLYLFVEDDRKELKILDVNTGRILKEDACPEEVDEKYSVSVKSVTCSPTSEFVGVLFSFKSNDSENYKTFVYSLKHLTFLPSPGITDLDCSTRISLHDQWMVLDRKVIGLTIFKLSESGVHLSDEISLPTDIKLQIEFCNGYFVFVYWPTTSKEESHVRIYSPSSKNLTKPSIFPATYCYTDVYNKFIFVYDSKYSFTSRGVWKPSSHSLEKCDFSVARFNHLPRWSRKVNRSFTNLFNKVELNQSPTCCSTLNLDDINTLRKINPTRWYLHHLW